MLKLTRLLPVLLTIMSCHVVWAQDDDDPTHGEKADTFRIVLGATVGRVSHSLYNHVEVIDERPKKETLGSVDEGTYFDLQVCSEGSLDKELERVFQQLTDSL